MAKSLHKHLLWTGGCLNSRPVVRRINRPQLTAKHCDCCIRRVVVALCNSAFEHVGWRVRPKIPMNGVRVRLATVAITVRSSGFPKTASVMTL